MKSYLRYEFNIDFLKYIGFLAATPLATLGFKILVDNQPFSTLFTLRGAISMFIAYIGFIGIIRARGIANEIDIRLNT